MNIMKRILIIAIITSCFISCGKIGKIHFTDLDFRKGGGNEYAYNKDGSVFTGTAWSSDEKTMKIEVNNGVINKVTLYHSNGKVAASVHLGNSGSRLYFDTNGISITKQQFKRQYPNLLAQSSAFEYEVHYIEE